jgi:acetoacetyl-CoA synthetase
MPTSRVDDRVRGAAVAEGDLLWTPPADRVAASRLTEFTRFAEGRTGRGFPDYAALWRWSTTELEEFWQAIWDFFEVRSSAPHTEVLAEREMPGARWFPGARLNFAEHVLRNERPGVPALLHSAEGTGLQELSWTEFGRQVRTAGAASGPVTGSSPSCPTCPRPWSRWSPRRASAPCGRASRPTSAPAARSTGCASSTRPC